MRIAITASFAFLTLAACTTTPMTNGVSDNDWKSIPGPNGQVLTFVECDGSRRNMSVCYERAALLCPSGYEVHDTFQGDQYFPGIGNIMRRNITIACEQPPA